MIWPELVSLELAKVPAAQLGDPAARALAAYKVGSLHLPCDADAAAHRCPAMRDDNIVRTASLTVSCMQSWFSRINANGAHSAKVANPLCVYAPRILLRAHACADLSVAGRRLGTRCCPALSGSPSWTP